MLKYGFSDDNKKTAVCGVKQWSETKVTAGYVLFHYGTIPDPLSVCPDSRRNCLLKAEAQVQVAMESLAESEGRSDPNFVAAKINDALQSVNAQIYEICAYLGQAIRIGGVILFSVSNRYLAIPLGGGEVYIWSEKQSLQRIGEKTIAPFITTNPLGNARVWKGRYWTGTLSAGERLLLASCQLPEDGAVVEAICNGSKPGSTDRTVAILLRQLLEDRKMHPAAILDLHSWQEGGSGV